MCGFQLNLLSINTPRNFISDTLSSSMPFIMSFFSVLVGLFPKIIHLVLLRFNVSLFSSNQIFILFNSFSKVSRSCSKLSPQQSKFVSDCCVRKYLFINLCFIICSLWLGVNDHSNHDSV